MKSESPLKFTNRLSFKFGLLALIAVVLPATAVAVSLILIGRHALTESIYSRQIETARRIASRVSIRIENVSSVLSIAAAEPGLASFSRPRAEESLRRLLRWQASFKEAFLINDKGRETAKLTSRDNRIISNRNLVSRRARPEFTSPVRSGTVYVSEPLFSFDHLPYLIVSVPVYGKKAVLAVKVSLEGLWDLVKEVEAGQPGTAYVIDRKGFLLAHPDSLRVQMHTSMEKTSIVRSLREGKSGEESFGVHLDERGEKVISIVQAVPGLGWGVVVEVPAVNAYAPIRRMQWEVLKWTSLSVFLMLAIVLWRVRRVVRPIQLLEEGARKISQGELHLDLNIRTGDEIERLSRSFTQMAQSLRQLEELRQDLISMIVHDLKSPLSAIMGGIDYLYISGTLDRSENGRKILNLSRKACDELLQMIQNLLDVAQMEEGKLVLKSQRISPAIVFEECLENFRIQMEKESKKLHREFRLDLPEISIDVQLIRRVLNNLVANAVRHTSHGGNITLAAVRSRNSLEVTVRDDGEGILPEYREKIFDKFVQAERRRVHLRSGTGLGLTFCKMAIELHGGQISVESELDKGTSFRFTLPLEETSQSARMEPVAAVSG